MKKEIYSKILVCAEHAPCADKALLQACHIAKKSNSKLYVIYVVDNPTGGLGPGIAIIDRSEFVKMFREHGKKVLQNAIKLAEKNGVKVIPIMKEGNVASEIIKFVRKEKIDLVAIGSRGLSRLPRFVLGSISNKIANYSPCTVLIVK